MNTKIKFIGKDAERDEYELSTNAIIYGIPIWSLCYLCLDQIYKNETHHYFFQTNESHL